MKINKTKIIVLYVLIIGFSLFSNPAYACNVPVFRYALERWFADCYEVFIFYRGSLTSEDKQIVDIFQQSSNSQIEYSNYKVNTVDLETQLEGGIKNMWEFLDPPVIPYMVVFYPRSFWIKHPVWHGRLTAESVKRLIASPVRSEIAKRILDGESAVWILLESGDSKKDNSAAGLLQTQLDKLNNSLTLPVIIDDGTFNDTVILNENGPELKIKFSMIRLSRENSDEYHLINMLMNSEQDLFEYLSYPMAFPVYGRGRILYTLIGEGINERNIQNACEFIVGPCSCIIKDQNPGVDILMVTDWNAGLEGRWIKDVKLPTLFGLSELANLTSADEHSEMNIKKIEVDESANRFIRNLLVTFGIIIITVIIISFRLKWSKNERGK